MGLNLDLPLQLIWNLVRRSKLNLRLLKRTSRPGQLMQKLEAVRKVMVVKGRTSMRVQKKVSIVKKGKANINRE